MEKEEKEYEISIIGSLDLLFKGVELKRDIIEGNLYSLEVGSISLMPNTPEDVFYRQRSLKILRYFLASDTFIFLEGDYCVPKPEDINEYGTKYNKDDLMEAHYRPVSLNDYKEIDYKRIDDYLSGKRYELKNKIDSYDISYRIIFEGNLDTLRNHINLDGKLSYDFKKVLLENNIDTTRRIN